MAEIRGEKVSFGRRDIVDLHLLPSARVQNPVIVHCSAPRSFLRAACKGLAALTLFVFLLVGGLIVAVETGSVDKLLSSQASQALERAMGPRYAARIGASVIRFVSGFRLALVARDVTIIERETGLHLSRAGAIGMALDPLALLAGKVAIDTIEADGMALDTALLSQGGPLSQGGESDPALQRLDAAPAMLETAFTGLDRLVQTFNGGGMQAIKISDITLHLPSDEAAPPKTVILKDLSLARAPDGGYALDGTVDFNGQSASLSLTASETDGAITGFSARLAGLPLGPLLETRDGQGVLDEGLEATLGLTITAGRAQAAAAPSLAAAAELGEGVLTMSGDRQKLSGGLFNARYDFAKNTVVIERSRLAFGRTVLPIAGEIRDSATGYDFALRIDDATASSESSGETPVPFSLTADGRYDGAARRIDVPALHVTGPQGELIAAVQVGFGKGSPEIGFSGRIPQMETSAVKQLWPFWMAHKARPWVMANLSGGTVRNGSIAVFIPQGRMCGPGCPLELDARELQIRFDIDDAGLKVAGDIPPLTGAAAHFELVGAKMDVTLTEASSLFPSKRRLGLEESRFSIASVYDKPLMADIDLNLSGPADALAELASFQPIDALKGTDFKPADFSGPVKARIEATVGLIKTHDPPPPVWSAAVSLAGVSLQKRMDGRAVTAVNGLLRLDRETLHLAGKSRIDDVPMEIDLVRPVRSNSKTVAKTVMKASLDAQQLAKFAPDLAGIVGGTTRIEAREGAGRRQTVKLDLSNATITLPGIGWSKGAGIAAEASFSLEEDDNRTRIDDFLLKGNGFGAEGALAFDRNGLTAANFSRVQLSPVDDYAVTVAAAKKTYSVTATGKSIDLRPLIGRLRNFSSKNKGKDDLPALDIKAQFERAHGFNDESLANFNTQISLRDGKLRALAVKGVIGRGEAVVAQTSQAGEAVTINLTSGDAGAFARFADIYSRMRGGLLNLVLASGNGADWNGAIDLYNFSVVNEAKLQDIVATPAGEDGQSLNKAVRRNIDVSSEKFQRGFARLAYENGTLSVDNGVVRGAQIGASFQGVVKDRRGHMEMTGTFMPAYGLNRLFGELPFIGMILGNGRDRGLLGITFKLTGPAETPGLVINPLSLIAPGVFRQIFEFQ